MVVAYTYVGVYVHIYIFVYRYMEKKEPPPYYGCVMNLLLIMHTSMHAFTVYLALFFTHNEISTLYVAVTCFPPSASYSMPLIS